MTVNHDVTGSRPVGGVAYEGNVIEMKLKDFDFNHQETHIYFYVPKNLIGDFAQYEYTKLRSVFQKGNKSYYYVDITVYNDNPNVLSDKTFPELYEAMQNYEIVNVDHNGLWSDFIYLGTMDNV